MKAAVAALNLGQDILTRLDAIAAAERRSRSNQARIFLETAMNADEALRRQAESHFQSLQMPGRFDPRSAASGVPVLSCGDAEGQEAFELPGQTGAVEATVFAGNTSPAPAYFFPETQGKSKMNVNADPHAQLKADALRTAADGIAARLYPKKPIEKQKDSST